ncbi:MAG: hypothetical protein V7K57_20885 [Nostoc sp.]
MSNSKLRDRLKSASTALLVAMSYILKAESYDRKGARGKLYCIITGSAVLASAIANLSE